MKKKLLMIYGWIIVSIAAQLFLYIFIDQAYLGNRGSITETMKVTTVSSDEPVKEQVDEPELSVNLPQGASDIKISYDGTYCAYILENKLNIIDISTNAKTKVIENKFVSNSNHNNKTEGRLTSFVWVPLYGKNVIMYGISSLPGNSGKAQIFSYDADADNEHVGVTLYGEYVPVNGIISDIVISPQTMVHYLKIKMNDDQERFIRINLMDEFNPSVTLNTGTVTKIGYFSEDLYYKDANNKINVKSGFKSPYILETSFEPVLVGLTGASHEGKDMIYLGSLDEEGKVDKIYYGIQGTEVASWKVLEVDSVNPENIIIKDEDEIFTVSSDGIVLLNLRSKAKIEVKGNYIDVVNGHLVYTQGNKLKFKPITKND